ncbi:MAG: hypothetical protein GX902_11865, partial [Lentisphaerae bacterium]|nr:hypothetical protein [Lentisphaerota bacterium]
MLLLVMTFRGRNWKRHTSWVAPPEIFVPEEEEDFAGLGLTPDNNYSITFVYGSDQAEAWEAALSPDGTLAGFTVRELPSAATLPKIARQDGVTGEMAAYFNGSLELVLTAESSDLTGLRLHYVLLDQEERWDDPTPDTTSESVASGETLTISATTRIKVAPYRNGQLCGPMVQQTYFNLGEIAAAINVQGDLEYTTTPHAPWTIDTDRDYNDNPNVTMAVSSPEGTFARPSKLQTTVTGPGCLVFWWQSYAPFKNQQCAFLDNDTTVFSISGQSGWVKIRYKVPEGQHTLTWQSIRSTESHGPTELQIDDVAWYPGEDFGFLFRVEGESAWVTDYLGDDLLVTVPGQDGAGNRMAGLDQWAFSHNNTIQGIILPEITEGYSSRYEIPQNVFTRCPALTAVFFQGLPPAYWPRISPWTTAYYPVDKTADWDHYFRGMSEYRQRWLPILYPLVSAPSITRVNGEPEENPDCFAESVSVLLSSDEPETVVCYTTDGTVPTADSPQAIDPLELTNTTTLTARVFREVDGVLQPCSAFSRRTFVNPEDFNQAVGVDADIITFVTDGDIPWKIYNRKSSQGVEPNDVVGTGPVFPGQRSTLYATFTLQVPGIFAYKEYDCYHDLPSICQLYDQDGQPVATEEIDERLDHNWYRYTIKLENGELLPPGTYTMVWSLEIPNNHAIPNYEIVERKHFWFLDDFSVGGITVPLTVQCEPQEGGRTFADGIEGSYFNKFIGQNVALRAEENANYIFREWLDGVCDKSRTITIKDPEVDGADANTYTACFDATAYIQVAALPAEAGSVSGGGKYYALGAEVCLSATPERGWRFDRWSDDEPPPGTDPIPAERSFICEEGDHNRTFTAEFVRCITVAGDIRHLNKDTGCNLGGGTVTGFGDHDVENPDSQTVIGLVAEPENDNYAFLGWDDNGNRVIDPEESTESVRELALTWNDVKYFHTTALFAYTAPVIIDYARGSENLGQITITKGEEELQLEDFRGTGCTLPLGTALTLEAAAHENSRFRGWQKKNGPLYTANPLTIEVSEGNNTYYAVFARLVQVEVTLADGSPEGCSARVWLGGVEQELSSQQEAGAFLQLEAVCAEHYRARWGNINKNTINVSVSEDPTANIYQVTFVPTYTVNLASSPEACPGADLPFAAQAYDLGTVSQFGAYGNNYWRFLHWQDGETDNNRVFNPAENGNYYFTAFFERYVRIECQAGCSNFEQYAGYNSFTGAGDIVVTDVPQEVTITAVPGAGCRFDCWTDAAANSLPDKTNPVRVFNISTANTLIQLKGNFLRTQLITVGAKPGTEAWGTIEGALDNALVDYGTEITFTATPNPNCQFVRWSDGVTNPTRRIMVRENATYLAEFASEAQVNIHIQAGQEGWGCQAGIVGPDGSLTASGIFPVGVWHTLEARPAANHRFVRWSDGQNSPSRDIRLTEQGFEITAIFAQTANLTLEFQTDPEGIAVPNWYCRWDGFDRAPGTYVIDVGTYTLRYYVHGNWAAPETEQITLTIGENKTLTRVFQLITDGTVTGYLNPSEIGGKWRIRETEEWLDNNTTLTLEAGDYEVEFKPVAGWLTPADQTIVVMANRKTSFTGVYSAIVPGVELTFSPSEVSEAAGPSATIATLRRVALEGNPIDLRKSLTVHLSASEKNALILPANSITIPAGSSLTQFQIGVIDNADVEDFLYDDEGDAIGRGRIVTLSGRVAMASHCNCNGKPTDGGIEQALEADLTIWDNDDSRALSVTASPSTLPERDALYPQVLTIARNEANPETEVLVELSAFITDKDGVSKPDGLDEDGNAVDTEIEFWMDDARLQFKFDGDPSVSMVMIPAGQASIKIDILARNDGKVDGNQVVSVFAEAQGYTPGSGWLMVSDLSFPDYVISNVATPGTALESGSTHSLQVSLSNNGNMDTPIGLSIPIAIYASRGNAASGQNLLLETLVEITEEQPLPKNGTLDFTFAVPLGNLFPADNWRFCVIVNPQNTLREVSNLNNRTWSGPFAVDAGYVTQLDPLPTASILPSESLVLTGSAIKSVDDQTPVPDVPVEVYFIYGQFRRALQTSSDADGRFSVEFVPQPTEIGRIIAGSCYPGTQVNTAQQEFDVLGFKYTAGGKRYLQWDLTVNTPETYTITLQNPNSTKLTGIQGAMMDDAQEKVELEFLDLADTLDGLGSQEVTFRVTATEPSPERAYEYMVLRFTSTEGAQLDIPVYLYAIPQFARLALDPISIDTTMQLGVARQVEVILSNEGAAETGPVTVTVPDLSWLTLPAGGNMPSIPPGESAVITIQLKGDGNTALGAPLSGTIAVNAENVQHGIQLPFRFTAVSEDKGSLQVTAMDEYTFNAKEEEDRTNLKNAAVTVKNPYTGAVLAIGNTGETGICLLENLPVGKCQVIVSADKHADNVQLVDIAPGDTVEIDAFLPYLAITYSWEMESTEIADEYELVLKTVYETNVPVPVVETIMTTIFIDMEPDSVRLINVTLINRGQIAAEGVWLNIVNTTDFTFESSQLDGITLAPQQSLTVPVVVRRGDGSATDCYTEVVTSYYYECGMDRRWHRFSKQITLLRCPKTTYNPTNSGAGSWWPGFDGLYGPLNPSNPASYNGPGLMTPSVPPLPYVPTGCIPCQNGLINAAIKCGIGFIPIAGCASGIMDAIGTIYESYKQGQANWKDIIVDGTLAGLGCFADETIGKVSDILSCIVGFIDACDGLEGYPPVPYPSPGGYTPDTGGGTRSDLTRAGDASWMEALQKKMYWGYRQGADHWAIIEEFYGEREWMNCDAPQLNAFNKAFGELSKATPVGIPVVPENAPELLAVLPTNLNSAHLAAFVARWNRTQAYWGTLSGGAGALLPGDTDDNGETIINLQLMRDITEDMELCESEAQKLGYTSVSALIIAVYAEAAEHANTSSSVCATISLEIKQKVTMTREAFEGTLTMSNGHETLPIEQIGLALQVTDANNNDCTHLFEIYPVADKFNGISALDGNGELAAKATGSAVVRFIPERGAAPEVPLAYNFGGTLTYKNPFSGLVAVIELTPVTMTVNPSPSLQVHYFLQRDILGDDSLTPDIIEPSYPAELSALVYNN